MILNTDIKLVASRVMDDVPEGGGAPTAVEIVDGASNQVFPDISESDRAGGRISLRKVNVSVQTDNRDNFLGSNIIVAEPPEDPNVSVTLFKADGPFETRDQAANRIEGYLIEGPLWPGFLHENHVVGMRQLQLFQRPGTDTPPIGRTLVLVYAEGLPGERKQFVRVTKVESSVRQFFDTQSQQDYSALIVDIDISDKLRYNFPGSPASKSFTASTGNSLVRNSTAADSGTYMGVVPLAVAAVMGDSLVRATGVYTQLVPNARTESIALDQRPSAERLLTLATTPRVVQVPNAPHTMRLKIGQENRGFNYVQILHPFPAPNSVSVSYRALGNWYTILDDGVGGLTGSGVGTVNYNNGSIAVTLPVLPDVGTSLIYSWGEVSSFTNRAGQAGFRPPEVAVKLLNGGVVPNSVLVGWMSGGVLRTVSDNGAGVLGGAGVGEVNYATGEIRFRPSAMIDAGGEYKINYDWVARVTKNVINPVVDAGGFVGVPLDTVPAPKSVSARWVTVRNTSNSSGGSGANNGDKTDNSVSVTTSVPTTLVTDTFVSGGTGPSVNDQAVPPSPAAQTRTPVIGGAVPPAAAAQVLPSVYQGGTVASTTQQVYIAVQASEVDGGYTYRAPDASGVVWTPEEITLGSKVIDGTTYQTWDYYRSNQQNGG